MENSEMTKEELIKLAQDVLADGKVDLSEATRLLGFMTPSVVRNEQYRAFRALLERVLEDGVVTDEESEEVAAALRALTAKRRTPLSVTIRLLLMMFFQMMTYPVWFNTVVPYIRTLPGGERWVPFCGVLMGVGIFASPIVCMFADRFFDSGKVLAFCNVGAALALGAAFLTTDAAWLFVLLLVTTCLLMPTWALISAIAMTHASPASFPYIRSLGSIGWAAAAVFSMVAIWGFGFEGFDKSPWILACGGATCVVAAVIALCLPATPPRARGSMSGLADAMGLRAFSLFKDRELRKVFFILFIAMMPFQWYFGYNTMYLDEAGFTCLNGIQSLGPLVEIGFLALLPWLYRRFGFKFSLMVGLGALAFRYLAFYIAYATGVHAVDYAGILIHGLIFGAIVVTAQMHLAERAPDALKSQAQGLVLILTSGVGDFLSILVFSRILAWSRLADGSHDWSLPFLVSIGLAVLAMVLLGLFCHPDRPSGQA